MPKRLKIYTLKGICTAHPNVLNQLIEELTEENGVCGQMVYVEDESMPDEPGKFKMDYVKEVLQKSSEDE